MMILIFMRLAAHNIDQGEIGASLILLTSFMMIMMSVVVHQMNMMMIAWQHLITANINSCMYAAFIYFAIFDIIWNILRWHCAKLSLQVCYPLCFVEYFEMKMCMIVPSNLFRYLLHYPGYFWSKSCTMVLSNLLRYFLHSLEHFEIKLSMMNHHWWFFQICSATF